MSKFKQSLKNYFVAGLLVVIPLATTIWLMVEVATWSIEFLTILPKQFNPIQGLHPLLITLINLSVGIAAPVGFILVIGFMARNIVGQWLLTLGEKILNVIPVAGLVYKTLKQLLGTLLNDDIKKFRRVVLLEYPRPQVWAIAFVTGTVETRIHPSTCPGPMLNVFVPTTPNPSTGWYALVPESAVIDLSMSVEDAFKLLISAGIVTPDSFLKSLQHSPSAPTTVPNLQELVKAERAAPTQGSAINSDLVPGLQGSESGS